MQPKTRSMARQGRRPVGRPRIELDTKLIGVLAEAGCSVDEMAAMLRRSGLAVDARTIKRRLKEPEYRDEWEEGIARGKANLRVQMVRQSRLMNGAGVAMAIHLSKHWLGMSDKSLHEHTGKDGQPIETRDVTMEQRAKALAVLLAKLQGKSGEELPAAFRGLPGLAARLGNGHANGGGET